MLLRLVTKNFLSFYRETVFDMFPNIKRERFENHIYDTKVPLLKQAAIYGANGSGKSNFIKAILFLRSFVLDDNFLSGIDLEDYRFQLVQNNELPISFEIEFSYKDKYYIYNVDIAETIKEELWNSGLGESSNKLIFRREGTEIVSEYLENNNSSKLLLQKNPASSLLPLNQKFPVLKNNADIYNISNWFRNELDIITIDSKIPVLIELLSNNKQLFEFANTIFQSVGIVNSLDICETPLDEWMSNKKNSKELQQILEKSHITQNSGLSAFKNNRNEFNIALKKGKKVVQEFMFEQMGINGYKKKMNISSQSDGTVRLLTLIPVIYSAMKKGKVVFIDEIENSIHPNLIFSLLKYYADNTSNGQLIYTTHMTKLLNQQKLLRLDEAWLVEKDNGNSFMRSLNDFKIHNTINIENGYLDGRYGGVPPIFEINNNE